MLDALQLLEVFARVADIDERGRRRNGRVGHYDHHVSVGREDVDEGGETRVLHFHRVN